MKRENRYQDAEVRRMKEAFESGKLSRRDFLQGLLAIGLTVSGATAIIADSRDARAETPKRGGRLKFAWQIHGPTDTLDPALFPDNLAYLRGRCFYNNLTQFNDDLSLKPDLAEEWQSNADATEWTFKLRQGVEWHDGSELSADDVVYTLNRHIGADSASAVATLVNMVSEWQKVDKYTMRAVLSSPNADLPTILGTFHFKIIKNGATGEYFKAPVGTGPFKVKEFTPGVRCVGVRNENYYREGKPYLDEIETFAITDPVARVNALIAGDVHIIAGVDPQAIRQIEAEPSTEMWSLPSGSYSGICIMHDREPGNNPDFVLAMKYLQPRERIVRSILKGHGLVANDHPIGPAYPHHCAELPMRPHDLEKAKFHLKKSGITEATVTVGDVAPGIIDTCLLLQREAQQIGLKLNVNRVPTDGYWGTVWRNQPLFATQWNMRPTANVMLGIAYASDAPWNETYWKNERFDALLKESRAELDFNKQMEMYCEMQQLISDTAGTVIPNHLNYIDAKLKIVKGVTNVPLSANGGMEWPEQVWLDT